MTTYNQLAKEYDDETASFWQDFPADVIERFCKESGPRVLDIGSGPGRDGLILQESGLDVTCLDASDTMVQLCRDKGLKAILGDFTKLKFGDSTFDSVWAYTSLLHVPKKVIDTPISEIVRVLVPNGILGLGMIEGKGERYRNSAGVDKPRWFSYYTQTEIESLLSHHGFKIIHFSDLYPGRTSRYLNFIARKV